MRSGARKNQVKRSFLVDESAILPEEKVHGEPYHTSSL